MPARPRPLPIFAVPMPTVAAARPTLADIQRPIAAELKEFERRFRQSMRSKAPLLDRITHYIIQRKGKQMRPMFTLLSARMFGPVNEGGYIAASLIELLHTATLVHDDVVDGSPLRRGFFSINALWKNKVAVLVGDYLLSRGLLLSVENGEHRLLGIVSRAVKEMSEGELLQMEKARNLNFSEEVYFDIIRQKTASLIAACCASGAAAAGASMDDVERMRRFGECTGIAFQIKDDLFDYPGSGTLERVTGKPTGLDIKEKKLTLPLIHALQQVDREDRRWMVNVVKNRNDDGEAVEKVMQKVVEAGGVSHARRRMLEYRDQALGILAGFPPTEARDALEGLVHLTVERVK